MMDTTKWKDLTPEYDAYFYSTLRTELQSRAARHRAWWRVVFVLIVIVAGVKLVAGVFSMIEEWTSRQTQAARSPERRFEEVLQEIQETSEKLQSPQTATSSLVGTSDEDTATVGVPADTMEVQPDRVPIQKPVEVERPASKVPLKPAPIWQEFYSWSAHSRTVAPKREHTGRPWADEGPFPRYELDRWREKQAPTAPRTQQGRARQMVTAVVGDDPRCPRGIPGAYAPDGPGWLRVYREIVLAGPSGRYIAGQCVWVKAG